MIYRYLGNTGMTVSAIGMGTWNIGNQWGDIDESTAFATIRGAIDAGVTLFDTSEVYGKPNGLSEQRLGRALAGMRHNMTIVSKIGLWGKYTGQFVPMTTNDMFVLCCHASLYRMRTDYIDIYLCHRNNLAQEETDTFLEGLEELKRRGLIRVYGISTDSLDVLKRFNKNNTCQVVEVEYSLINRAPESGILDYAKEHNIGVLVRGPICKGLLSGKYNRDTVFEDSVRSMWNEGGASRDKFHEWMHRLDKISKVIPNEHMAETAIRFTISHPASPVAIPGAKTPQQAAANAKAGERLLTAQEYAQYVSL